MILGMVSTSDILLISCCHHENINYFIVSYHQSLLGALEPSASPRSGAEGF